MKRDLRLRGLSSEHHHALTLARSLERQARAGGDVVGAAAELVRRFDAELEPHFGSRPIEPRASTAPAWPLPAKVA